MKESVCLQKKYVHCIESVSKYALVFFKYLYFVLGQLNA